MKKSLDKYRFAKMLTDTFIENILILLNNIYKNSIIIKVVYKFIIDIH